MKRAAILCLALLLGCGRDSDPAPAASRSTAASEKPAAQEKAAREKDESAPQPEVVFETPDGELRVKVEVVSTPALIQRGLMHRRHLAPDRGMLFVFGSDRVRSFWMKNTLIPLDMLFVRSDLSIAGIERDTVPLSLKSRSVGIPTRYVLEVNGGWTARHGIEAGDQLRFENLPEIANPPP